MTDPPTYPGMPRWVKVFGMMLVVLVLLALVLLFTRGPGGHGHGPGLHFSSAGPGDWNVPGGDYLRG